MADQPTLTSQVGPRFYYGSCLLLRNGARYGWLLK